MTKANDLLGIYSQMDQDELQKEVDAIFDMVYALLEATESDSIEQFPNPNIKLRISCEVIKDEGKYYC